MNSLPQLRKAVNEAHEKANLDEHMLVYNVGLGATRRHRSSCFEPMKSLKEFDDGGEDARQGLGILRGGRGRGQEDVHRLRARRQQFFVRDFLAISPGMSYVSEKVDGGEPELLEAEDGDGEDAAAKATKPAAKKETQSKDCAVADIRRPVGKAGHF